MRLEHRIDEEARLLVIAGTPAPAVQAARESVAFVASDPRVAGVRGALILVSAETPTPSGMDILLMSGLLSSLTHIVAGPVAIVVAGEQHESAASMMALSGDRPHRVEYFSNEADARNWLQAERSA
ncbi:MAG: hypothetical protein U0Q55_06960 [Vicinamibacterales bacterium]